MSEKRRPAETISFHHNGNQKRQLSNQGSCRFLIYPTPWRCFAFAFASEIILAQSYKYHLTRLRLKVDCKERKVKQTG